MLSPVEKLYLYAARGGLLFVPWAFRKDNASLDAVLALAKRGLLTLTMANDRTTLTTTPSGLIALAGSVR